MLEMGDGGLAEGFRGLCRDEGLADNPVVSGADLHRLEHIPVALNRLPIVAPMVRDARRCRAPHHEGLADLILRSIAKRCVSKDVATAPENALVLANPSSP